VAATSHANIDGDRRVRQLLSEMADRTRGVEPAWPGVGDVIAEHMFEQFASEGSHLTGHAWAPLTPKYLAWKVSKGFHHERLRQTDQMRLSLISRPLPIEEYRPSSARFGTDDEKAAFHQEGTRFMPQRKIIEVDANPDFADDVNSVLARYIFENRLR
jgi:hypothetical protein